MVIFSSRGIFVVYQFSMCMKFNFVSSELRVMPLALIRDFSIEVGLMRA